MPPADLAKLVSYHVASELEFCLRYKYVPPRRTTTQTATSIGHRK